MRLAIMQPYFFPYIGYYQLLRAVDVFVVYDDVEFTKSGWIHRNRILCDGKPSYISLPLKKASDFLLLKDRVLADTFDVDRQKLLRKIAGCYVAAPRLKEVLELVRNVLLFPNRNLFDFIFHSLHVVAEYLEIDTRIVLSSSLKGVSEYKGVERVHAICEAVGSRTYINLPGGRALYEKADFLAKGVNLQFLIPDEKLTYRQGGGGFVERLSIVDVLMWNARDDLQALLKQFSLE